MRVCEPLCLHDILLYSALAHTKPALDSACVSYRNVPRCIARRSFSTKTSQPRTESPTVWTISHGSVPSAHTDPSDCPCSTTLRVTSLPSVVGRNLASLCT